MASGSSRRQLGVVILVTLLVLMLSSVAFAQTPRPTPTTPGPRPTRTEPPPRPTTSPYPGGAGAPAAQQGNSYFVGDNTPAPGQGDGLATLVWVALAIFGVGLTVRWFYIAARDEGTS